MDTTATGTSWARRQAGRERVEAFNAHDLEKFSAFYADDAVPIAPSVPEPLVCRAAIHQNGLDFSTAVPEVTVEPVDVFVDGNTTVLEVVLRGSQTGPLNTPGAVMPPTGNQLRVPMVLVRRFGDDRKIVREDRFLDSGTMLRQLGVA